MNSLPTSGASARAPTKLKAPVHSTTPRGVMVARRGASARQSAWRSARQTPKDGSHSR
jgi:hypothetical protein